ncbi:hypothetical protein TWF192_003422 [Orbilia oligospora]|uniref:Uncharacterized protein n=1 Tax=Orbilia oligospora TaxID=2813651 RepID=A0A6G1LQT0_ORBOL|nr:hypothetical protein TWF679_000963 [Orbilia oligospora]KAF3224307.1 hypothetical protein TWF191_006089 [Orbilia oligospora]KAF3231717.1 hypothetical protein TWF192_003422 [Orbilia oligospora]
MSSSRSASNSSRPSLSSTRSTPPTDDGGSKMASPKKAQFPDMSLEESIDNLDDISTFPPEVALPAETSHDTLLETTSKDATEIDAIFEQSDSESESPLRPPSIPDYHFSGPRNYSRLTERDSDDERSGTPPPNPFGPSIRAATLKTAGRVAGDNGIILPSTVSESPSPYVSRSRLSSSRGGTVNSVFQDVPIFSPFSSQKKKKNGKNGFPRGNPSPNRKGGRILDVPVAPSPDPSPLVLLHVTLLPLPAQGPASSVLANHLRKMISPTVVARGLLLPHPNDDYEGLIEMIAENLGLDQETPPPFKKTATYSFDDCASHSEGSYVGSSDEEGEGYCPTCTRRRLKPEYCRHERPRKHRRPYTHTEKWYTINIFASNGLMRSGAWSRSWEEMERIDVEVTVTPGYEDIDPPKTLRPSSQRSDGKRSLQGGFQFKRRVQPLPGVETTTDEEMPQPRRLSAGRRKPSGARVPSGSMRSRNSSNYIKQEPLSELDIMLPDVEKAKEIYEDGVDLDVPIFEPPTEEDGEFVPIWEDKDDKEEKPTERFKSEDSWTTDDEGSRQQDNDENAKRPSQGRALATEKEEDRRLSAFTMDTAIHHSIIGSSRETSVESEAIGSESEDIPTVSPSPSPEQRKISNPHRLHPSSRRASREITPAELRSYAASEKTASRPTSSRNPGNMAIVGLAISDDGAALEDLEEDKENRHESIDNKENIPVDISDEEPEVKPTPLRNRRAVTPKTAGPSPMPSRFSSPDISPDISPMVSRAGSPQPQPTKGPTSRERRRRSIRRSFDKSFGTSSSPGSRAQSRKNSGESGTAPFTPGESSPRGRSVSRSPKQSQSSSPSPLEKEEPLPEGLIDRLRDMLKPTINTLSAIPLPTLLLIAIPFAGLIAFSVNSYFAQRNLDSMVRNFMETQVAREMQILQQQQQAAPDMNQVPLEVQYAPAPPSILSDVIAEVEKMLPGSRVGLLAEEKANLEWQEAQKRGLERESVVYGIQVGGKCVMPEDVPAAIRRAASEREDGTSNRGTIIDDLDLVDEDEAAFGFAPVKLQPGSEIKSGQEQLNADEDARGRGEQKSEDEDSGYERSGSRSPPLAPYRRDRSRERKNFPEEPTHHYHSPNLPVYDDFDRLSEAGDIDVGKADVRDGGPDWRDSDIPELELPPPIREVPASPSKVQIPIMEPSQEAVEPGEADQDIEEPTNTPVSEVSELEGEVSPEVVEPVPEEDERLPEPIIRTGYTPQQRPSDYNSRPSSRSGDVDESDNTSQPETDDVDTDSQDAASRPPTRNGRASSRPPSSRSASKSRASSRSSRSRSRPRSSGGSKNSDSSSGTVETVEEGENVAEQIPEEITAGTHDAPDSQHDENISTNLPESPKDVVPEVKGDESFLERLGLKFGPQRIFGPMPRDFEAPAATPTEEALSSTSTPALEPTIVEQETEDVLSVGSASPALTSSEPPSEYEHYEDAEEDYDYDDQYQYQYDPDQYDDYAYDSQDDYHNIPEALIDEDYAFEDEDGDGSAYDEVEEFDYEKFKASQ